MMKKIVFFVILIILFFVNVGEVNAETSTGILYDIDEFVINPSSDTVRFKGVALKRYANNYSGILSDIYLYAVGNDGTTIGASEPAKYDGCGGDTNHCKYNNYYGYRAIYSSGGIPQEYSDGVNSYCSRGNNTPGAGNCILRNIRFEKTFKLSELMKLQSPVRFKLKIKYDDSLSSRKNKDIFDNVVNGPQNANLRNELEIFIGVAAVNCNITGKGACNDELEKDSSGNNKTNVLTYNGSIISINGITNNVEASTAATPITAQKYISSTGRYDTSNLSVSDGLPIKIEKRISNGMRAKYRSEDLGILTSTTVYEVKRTNGGNIVNDVNAKYLYNVWIQTTSELSLNFGSVPTPPVEEEKVNANGTCDNYSLEQNLNLSTTIKVSATYGDPGCRKTVFSSMTAEYKLVQTGDLIFNLQRDPIYNGGHFDFSVDYYNRAVWSYGRRVDACPSIRISHPYLRCSITGCYCAGVAFVSADTKYVNRNGRTVASSISCPSGKLDAAKSHYQLEVAKNYNSTRFIKNRSSGVVTMPDSNKVGGPVNSSPGKWECSNVTLNGGDVTNFTNWYPNEERVVKCTYKLKNSYINKQTSTVTYSFNDMREPNKYIKHSGMYFVPLKWNQPLFTFNTKFNDISSLISAYWNIAVPCDVETLQRLYDENRKNVNNVFVDDNYIPSSEVSFMYFYRPIMLGKPFPNDRDAGINWITWINKSANRNRLVDTYNNLEYSFNLDKNTISYIRNTYNKNKINEGDRKGYLDYDELNINGKSNFIGSVINNLNTKRNSITYQGLGVFDEKLEVVRK